MRVLMLATYFPKPLNPLMGNWALSQAQAFLRQGMRIEVVSLTAWVPRLAAATAGAGAYAYCPSFETWDGLPVWYPRWPVYPVGPMRRPAEANPRPFLDVGWQFVRRFLSRRIGEFKPDIVYAHHTAVNGYLAENLRRLYALPYVVTDHDFGEINSCELWPKRRRMFENVIRNSSKMIAVASRMEGEIKRLFPFAVTETVYNGAEPILENLLRKPRPPKIMGKLVLFSCGSLCRRKGFPVLVDAFAKVASMHPESILRIGGDGEDIEAVRARIEQHRLHGRVELLGRLAHRDVQQEMVWSDAFALLGWDEPFATVLSEAASAGKPIICCDDGGFTDVLQHGTHGLTVPPKDVDRAAQALDLLLTDGKLRERMGREAKKLFETRLRWEHNAAEMFRIFQEACSR